MMDSEELRKIAEAATPGPWEMREESPQMDGRNFTLRVQGKAGIRLSAHCYGFNSDPEFIATFDPTTVLALLTELEQYKAQVARVREEHRPVDVEPSETICHACSTLRGNGESLRYFPYKEWPCDTIRALDGDGRG